MSSFTPSFNEVAAGRVHESAVVVSLDKLVFTTNYPLDRDALIERAQPANKGDGYVIEKLPKGHGATLFFADAFDAGLRFSLNPSRFNTVWDCRDAIESVLGRSGLRATIKYIDIALTFPCDFYSLYMGLDFGFRRQIKHLGVEGFGETVYVGKLGKSIEIKIYDKTKEMKAKAKKNQQTIDYPCSRIEITWKPDEETRIEDLSRVLDIEPFVGCTAHKFSFVEPDKNARPQIWRSYFEFEQKCLRWGYWHTRKKLNKKYKNNFSKRFGNFFDLEEMQPTLDEIYRQGIRVFFQQ